jgi:hypothetical protein
MLSPSGSERKIDEGILQRNCGKLAAAGAPYYPLSRDLRDPMNEAFEHYWAEEIKQENIEPSDSGSAENSQSTEN